MTSIRKFWWTGLVLAAFVGCAEEQSTGPAAAPEKPGTPAPTTPPAGTKPEAKEATPDKGEMKDAPEPKAGADKSDAPPVTLPKVDAPKPDAPADKPDADKKAGTVKLSDDELAEVKNLPADEQALALKQLVCPVSDEHLGAMGTPLKVTAEGKTFYLCCKGCKKDVDKDAKTVVAKLKN